ncbi:hypothetical protein WJX84_010557 [Apatococcus fuscideae]|uniref:ABC1 atypical kinase-like domain-containing protein n=1 Tax=Apatococcus fuscideae TaxID=2026836 RepID=A0AAW1SYV6_9CHLO
MKTAFYLGDTPLPSLVSERSQQSRKRTKVQATAAPPKPLETRRSSGKAPEANGVKMRHLEPHSSAAAPFDSSAATNAVSALASQADIAEDMAIQEAGVPLDSQQFTWSNDSYSSLQRSVEIWSFVIGLRSSVWLLDQKWSYLGFSEEQKSKRLRGIAAWCRERILSLGPTFIKIGQLFSTRTDILPAEVTEELSRLQDRVPAFPSKQAVAILERELGMPVTQAFRSFQQQPIAAASLGQVHRAVLHTGEQVVVKVQRPGLQRLFEIDLANLKILAAQLDKGDENRDFKGIYAECAKILWEEVDYINEGRNADRFRRNFASEDWVRVPRIHWRQTTPVVLTLEYMPGLKVTDKKGLLNAGLNPVDIARIATEAYLLQILRHGFLHSDPHAGNIAVDKNTGALLFYDFGMMSSIFPGVRERLLDIFYGVYKKDADAVLQALVDLNIIVTTGDTLSLKRAISYFLDNIAKQADRQETLSAIGEDLFTLAVDQPFRFPAAFTFVLRAFTTLEGIGRSLDPNFQFSEVAQPYATELLQLKDQQSQGFVLDQLQKGAAEVGRQAIAVPSRVERMSGTLTKLETGDLKLRVRVLESERAAYKANVMQMATIQAVTAAVLLDVGTQLALSSHLHLAQASFGGSGIFAVLLALQFRRLRKLDQFEKAVKSGGSFSG